MSSLTQAHICTTDDALEWYETDSRIELSAHENLLRREYPERPIEELICYINYNALVAQKLELIALAVSRFLDEKERDLPSGSWEKYDIRSLRAESQEYGIERLQRAKDKFLQTAIIYGKSLGTMWEKLLPLDIEAHLRQVDLELEIFPNGGVAGLPTEPRIFLQLYPSYVPGKYLKLAEKVHFLSLHHSIHDGTVTDPEKSLYSAFYTAALSYRKKQTCMLENRLTRDSKTYLDSLSQETIGLFPELGIFLELRPFEVPPQDEVNESGVLYSAFHVAAESYTQTLERIQQSLETANIEYYLQKLKKNIARDVPFNFARKFPQLVIFLQLHPSDVPPQYVELAELVHALCFGPFMPDEPVTDREYETASQRALCSASHYAALPESDHDNRNDVAYADLGSNTITSNRGSKRRPDIAGPSSSSSHGSRRNHHSSRDRTLSSRNY
ncbi:hypothetical protein SeLEV6574_g00724 [Synchytrium endobioticum]|uniref:Uncharacterized protein n=1 Tax=Synchytrium endobioticum TaxID=286115 RepID=A0A507DIS1_9FUNG|nr:hypothetical protein SeLEV6574_g00724 [Synchytrium endobioticum]